MGTAAMSVPRQRVLDLMKVQSRIFSTIFNPAAQRLGNKVLRQRLRGPSLAAYYPRRVATFKDLKALYPNHELYDEDEEDRLEHIQIAKSRGKGAPKKKKTAAGEYRIITSTDMVGDVRRGFREDNADLSLVQKAGRSLVRRNRLAEALWMVERCMIIACWRLACLCTDDALSGVAGAGTIPRKSRKFVLHHVHQI